MEADLELRTDAGGWGRSSIPASVEAIRDGLSRLSVGDIGTIHLKEGHQELWISGGPTDFSVWAVVGPDDFFDLVGDPNAIGTRDLVVGGQEVEHPLRHCVSAEEALRAAWQFTASRRIAVSEPQWERQGLATNP
jgi:hypothetical protein